MVAVVAASEAAVEEAVVMDAEMIAVDTAVEAAAVVEAAVVDTEVVVVTTTEMITRGKPRERGSRRSAPGLNLPFSVRSWALLCR